MIVTSADPVTLVGGGPVDGADLSRAVALAPLVVAADSGVNRAHALGQRVDHVIGDMDSTGILPLDDHPQFHPIPEQMTTDLDKCLYSVAAPFFIGVGFLGGRLDHTLAACHALVRADAQRVVLLGETDLVFLAPQVLALDLPVGTRLSLFPMGAVSGESSGLEYPLAGHGFSPDRMIGTSNAVTGPVRLRLDARRMLVILPKAFLEDVREQVFR